MYTLDKEAAVISVYLSDQANLFPDRGVYTTWFTVNEKNFNQFPVMDLFKFNEKEDIYFTDGLSISNNIPVRRVPDNNMLTEITNTRKPQIRPCGNDLLISPVTIALNFTPTPVTFVEQNGFRKTIRPISGRNFTAYSGNLYIFTLYSFNSIDDIEKLTEHGNYISELLERQDRFGLNEYKEVKSCLEEIKILLLSKDFKKTVADHGGTYKVVTSMRINDSILDDHGEKGIYVRSKKLLISRKDIVRTDNNPSGSCSLSTIDMKQILNSNSFSCYINDPDDKITDRYISVAGKVIKVSRVKNKDMPTGIYAIYTNEKSQPEIELVFGLDKIDECEFIFRTREEAIAGADKKGMQEERLMLERNKHELEKNRSEIERLAEEKAMREAKLKYELEKLQAEESLRKIDAEYKLRLNAATIEANEQKLRHDKELAELKRKMEEDSAKANEESMNFKTQYERERHMYDLRMHDNKTRYEESKYKKDAFVETLKTVGAVAGVAAAGILLYKKLT